jgi:hypothetical protein
MNYISSIIQILEIPTIESYEDNIEMVRFRIQLPYVRNKDHSPIVINSTIWGDLAHDIANYYKLNDYALIEGYLSIGFDTLNSQQEITLNIIKLYPFLFTLESKNHP